MSLGSHPDLILTLLVLMDSNDQEYEIDYQNHR